MAKRKRKHLMIGCGSAALSALKQMRKLGSDDQVKLVTMEDHPPYSPMSLPYLISGRIEESNVYLADNAFFEKMKATHITGRRVASIDTRGKSVTYDNDDREAYDMLLIATGSEPIIQRELREAGIPGFHIMDDYIRLKQLKDKSKITILGAGFVGMELAASLAEKGLDVHVIAPRERILRQYFDAELDLYIIGLFVDRGILIDLNFGEVTQVKKQKNMFNATFACGKNINTGMLIAATGVVPRIAFLSGSGVKLNRGILVDDMMRTNITDVFAAGDVAETRCFFTGKNALSLILPSAVEQGKIAGSNMVGKEAVYDGWISKNVFNFFGCLAISIGQFLPSEGDDVLVDKDHDSQHYKKLVFRDNRLVGANFFNIDVDAGVIQYLIKQRIDIGEHKDSLLENPKEVSLWLMLDAEKKETISLEA